MKLFAYQRNVLIYRPIHRLEWARIESNAILDMKW